MFVLSLIKLNNKIVLEHTTYTIDTICTKLNIIIVYIKRHILFVEILPEVVFYGLVKIIEQNYILCLE